MHDSRIDGTDETENELERRYDRFGTCGIRRKVQRETRHLAILERSDNRCETSRIHARSIHKHNSIEQRRDSVSTRCAELLRLTQRENGCLRLVVKMDKFHVQIERTGKLHEAF